MCIFQPIGKGKEGDTSLWSELKITYFIAALFTTIKRWKHTWRDEWTNKMWCICAVP